MRPRGRLLPIGIIRRAPLNGEAMIRRLCSLAVLPLVLGGCGACSKSAPEEATQQPIKSDPPAREVLPSKTTVTAVVYTTKGRAMTWMETIASTFGTEPDKGLWTGHSFVIPENSAWRYYLTDGSSFGAEAPPADGTPLSEVLTQKTEAPAGYAWEVTTGSNGFHRVFINPALGKKQRLGMYPEAPSAPVWLEGTSPAPRGTAAPALSKNAGWESRGEGLGFANTPPVGSTPIATAEVAAEELARWTDTLTKLRGAPVTVEHARAADLDGDQQPEGLVCVVGGRGNPCYIVDDVDGQTRYYSTALQWAKGDPADAPQVFSTSKGTYIMHSPAGSVTSKGGGIVRVVRFDGSGYTTDIIQ